MKLEKNPYIDVLDKLVSKNVRYRRKSLGMSQRELGEYLNVSIPQIQKYETGINRISSGKLYALTILLDVPFSYFFNFDNSNT